MLTERQFDAIRFRGPGTDLLIGLLPLSIWNGASAETAWGRSYVPNLPTEEVFTTPDPRRTEGTVRSTRPLVVGAVTIRDLALRFQAGHATEVHASSGEDVVRAMIATDAGAARLGEVALVDGTSRVGRLGITFRSTLLDENATCHIALGQGLAVASRAASAALPTSCTSSVSTSPVCTRTSWWVALTSRWRGSAVVAVRCRCCGTTSGS